MNNKIVVSYILYTNSNTCTQLKHNDHSCLLFLIYNCNVLHVLEIIIINDCLVSEMQLYKT